MTNPVIIGTILAIIWFLLIAILVTPPGHYRSKWDRLTRAKYRPDRVNLQIMLDHLRSYPEQWSINREAAAFPIEGSKQIYLNYDKNSAKWRYTLNGFDDGPRVLDGHFGIEFNRELEKLNNKKENQALLRNFYPDLNNGVLLLK